MFFSVPALCFRSFVEMHCCPPIVFLMRVLIEINTEHTFDHSPNGPSGMNGVWCEILIQIDSDFDIFASQSVHSQVELSV